MVVTCAIVGNSSLIHINALYDGACDLWRWMVIHLREKQLILLLAYLKKKVPQKGPTVKPVACTDRLTILLVFLSIPIQSWNEKENKNSYINALDLFTYTWTTARHQYKCKLQIDSVCHSPLLLLKIIKKNWYNTQFKYPCF